MEGNSTTHTRLDVLEETVAALKAEMVANAAGGGGEEVRERVDAMAARLLVVEEGHGGLDSRISAVQKEVEGMKNQQQGRASPPDDGRLKTLTEQLERVRQQQQHVFQQQQAQQRQWKRMEADGIHVSFKVVPVKREGRETAVPTGANAIDRVNSALKQVPGLGNVAVSAARVVKERGGGTREFLIFKVASQADAELVRDRRRGLKGGDIAIVDMLTTEEYATFKQLKPKYDAAVAAQQQAYWKRVRLFIDGKEVKPTRAGDGAGAGGQGKRRGAA
jgi:hypothetical protein